MYKKARYHGNTTEKTSNTKTYNKKIVWRKIDNG